MDMREAEERQEGVVVYDKINPLMPRLNHADDELHMLRVDHKLKV